MFPSTLSDEQVFGHELRAQPCARSALTPPDEIGRDLSLASHWDRLLGGELYAPLSRADCALLLRRTFDVDVKRCRSCGGRLTVRTVVTDPASIAKLLGALRRSRDPPVAA